MCNFTGGFLQWKIQKLDVKPSVSNQDIINPLPNPPDGYEWTVEEKTRTWSIQRINSSNVSSDDGAFGLGKLVPVKPPHFDESAKKDDLPPTYEEFSSSSYPKYLEHVILPGDTLQGLCIRYKISPVKLRQVNQFSGSNLSFAPAKLYIPVTEESLKNGVIKLQDRTSKDFKLHSFMSELRSAGVFMLSRKEATYYLELSDWDIDSALKNAQDDMLWEQSVKEISNVDTGVMTRT